MSAGSKIVAGVALFGSASTLLCCALPALLVSLGAGAVMAGLVSAVPQIVWVSEHKVGVFVFAGCALIAASAGRYLTRNAPCPVDPMAARACARMKLISSAILGASILLYAIGFFFAFIASHVL